MISPVHFILWKIGVLAWSLSFTIFAVTEAFLGQMAISLTVALIGATPPTIAIILMNRKQSAERKEMHVATKITLTKMAEDLDGKLDKLSKAETGQARAEGIIEGSEKEIARAASHVTMPEAIVANTKDNPVVNKPAK